MFYNEVEVFRPWANQSGGGENFCGGAHGKKRQDPKQQA